MEDQIQNTQDEDKSGIGPVAAAVAGAVVGAGAVVAGAVAVALNNKKNDEKEEQALAEVKDKAVNYYSEDVQEKTPEEKI